jgi:predicted esterase
VIRLCVELTDQDDSFDASLQLPDYWPTDDIPISESTRDDEASLIAATKSVLAYVDSLNLPREQIILGGFSQGAAMSLLTALESDRPFAGVIMLSGWAPMRNKLKEVFARDSTAHVGTKVFYGHGTSDNVVLFDLAKTSAAVMANEGLDVMFTGYPTMQVRHFIKPYVVGQDYRVTGNVMGSSRGR